MTKHRSGERTGEARPRCAWCGRPLPDRAATGRPRRYCRAGCRQQAYQARRFAEAHGLGDGDVVVGRQELEAWADQRYCLEAALQDVVADLAADDTPATVAEALAWLREHAEAVVAVRLEPRGTSGTISP